MEEGKMTVRTAIGKAADGLGEISLSTELMELIGPEAVQLVMNQFMIPVTVNLNLLKNVCRQIDEAEAEAEEQPEQGGEQDGEGDGV